MANNIDRHIPRTQGGVVDKKMPVSTFLRDTFFPDAETFPTNKVELDFRKGAYSIAPFVAPLVNGIIMERNGYTTKEYEPPIIAPKRVLNPKILEKTVIGENVYSLKTPAERQEEYIKRDMKEMDDAISRREEQMVAELLTTGQISVRAYHDEDLTKYIDSVIDYQFNNKEVLSGGFAWDQGTSTKYDDLEDKINKLREAGYNPNKIIFGQTAWKLLRDDADFKDKLDTRRIALGNVNPSLKITDGTGSIYMGDLTELGVEMWVYYGYYKDYDGVVKKYIPEDHVVITSEIIGDIAYGAVTYLNQTSFDDGKYVTYEGTRIPRTFINQKSNVKEMILSSKPIPRPFDVDSWFVLDVLG